MIAPVTRDQHEYVEALAVHLLRAREQVEGGDTLGSRAFTDAFRSLEKWGDARYPRENAGLVEYARALAAEENERVRAVMERQDAAIVAAAPEPEPEASTTPEPVSVDTTGNISVAEGNNRVVRFDSSNAEIDEQGKVNAKDNIVAPKPEKPKLATTRARAAKPKAEATPKPAPAKKPTPKKETGR